MSPARTSTGQAARSGCSPSRCPGRSIGHPRTAAVSSFGISGTNAHLILQQAPTPPAGSADAGPPPANHHVLSSGRDVAVSARTPAALQAQADRLHHHLVAHPDLDLADVAYSLGSHPHTSLPSGGDHRAGGHRRSREDLLEALPPCTPTNHTRC